MIKEQSLFTQRDLTEAPGVSRRTPLDEVRLSGFNPQQGSGAARLSPVRETDWPVVQENVLADFASGSGPGAVNYGSADGDAGTVHPNGKPIWGVGRIAEHLHRSDMDWDLGSGDTLTFGFFEDAATVATYYPEADGFTEATFFSAFTDGQLALARYSMGFWDGLADITLSETTDDGAADIRLGNTDAGPFSQAYAYLPFGTAFGTQYESIAGDIWISNQQPSNFDPLGDSFYAQTTMIHEIGHALGLSHPGDYNATGAPITYEGQADYYQDSLQYTIMSYWGAHKTGAAHIDWSTLTFKYAATPLIHDIAAIQDLYGTDTTTRVGDTTYGFNSNAGLAAYDFSTYDFPIVSIWDAGGEDALDFSGFATPTFLDLHAGSFSSAGGSGVVPLQDLIDAGILPPGYTQAQYDALRVFYNSFDGLLHDNISIAYGTRIENAVGGSGDDTILPNQFVNVIDGGAGSDTVSYEASGKAVEVTLDFRGMAGEAKKDTYISIENIIGSAFDDTLNGDAGDNVIDGGPGGSDVLDGRGGFDTLSFAMATDRVTVNLATGVFGGEAAGDVAAGFEGVSGSNFNDLLRGDDSDNLVDGFAGNDIVYGGKGNDTVVGGDGNDFVKGDGGDDIVQGGKGDDTIKAGSGDDSIEGGDGADRLTGFTGADRFVYNAFDSAATDKIADFESGKDLVDLAALDADSTADGNQAFDFVGDAAFSGTAGELRAYDDGGKFTVEVDTDGDGAANWVMFTTGQTVLVESDFVL